MCELCYKIYKKEEEFHLKEYEEDAYYLRNMYDDNMLSTKCILYYYNAWDKKEQQLFLVNYCPSCGAQVTFDNKYEGTLLDKKYKIIKEG